MLKKILKKKQPTEKVGSSQENTSGADQLVPYIYVPNLEQNNAIHLDKRVTLGSVVGDLIIPSGEISPRHCTFFCNKGVFSLIDHASKSGTFINKRKIEPNKIYLLDENDKIRIGKQIVEIDFRAPKVDPDLIEKVVTDELPVEEDEQDDETRELTPDLIKALNEDKTGDLEPEEEGPEEIFTDTEIIQINENSEQQETLVAKKIAGYSTQEVKPQVKKTPNIKKQKTIKKVKIKTKKVSSSSALSRVISFINDALIAFIIVEVCSVFSEFRAFYTVVPEEILEVIKPLVTPHIDQIIKSYPSLSDLTVQVNGIEKTKEIFQFLTFLFLIKMITSVVFSISLGQFFAGIRVEGNFLWKRLIAPVRIFIGILLFPFLIFDFPTIFSKRSFKEVLTKTQFVSLGGIIPFLMMIVFTPLLVTVAIISPLYKGFEELPRVGVNIESKAQAPHNFSEPIFIEALGVTIDRAAPNEVLPFVDLKLVNGKEILESGALIINTDNGSHYKIKKVKAFSFIELFSSFVAKNPLVPHFQPEIHGLVKNVANNNKNFDLKINNQNQLIVEVSNLVKDSYGVHLADLPDFVVRNGIFIGAFRDFREKLSSLYELKPEVMKVMTLGKQQGLFATHGQGRMQFHTFIPIGEATGIMYKIEGQFNAPKMNELRGQIYFGNKTGTDDVTNIAAYINASHVGLVKDNMILNQEVYSRYFEVSKKLVLKENQNALNVIKQSLNQLINILNLDDKSNQKLTQNLTELLQALKTEDKEYFNINTTEVI